MPDDRTSPFGEAKRLNADRNYGRVVELRKQGFQTKRIAQMLGIDRKTVMKLWTQYLDSIKGATTDEGA